MGTWRDGRNHGGKGRREDIEEEDWGDSNGNGGEEDGLGRRGVI
jgi:hypothetical protein